MVETANTIWRDWITDGVPSSDAWEPRKREIREWGAWLESLATLAFSSGRVYASKAAMESDLSPSANSPAIVIGDPAAGNDGLYAKVGSSGTGSWQKISDHVPGMDIVFGYDLGEGTPNAIRVTALNAVSGSSGIQLLAFTLSQANTSSPVTVSFNNGAALTIKTVSGTNIPAGGLSAGQLVAGFRVGSEFRLLTDIASAAIQAAAEAARVAAEAARDLAASYAAQAAVDRGINYPFATIAAGEAATIPSAAESIQTERPATGRKRARAAWARTTLLDIQRACAEPEWGTILCAQLTGTVGATAFQDVSRHKHVLASAGQVNVAASGPTVYGLPMAYFDGSGDLVSAPTNDMFGQSGDFTIHFYARCEDLAANRLLFAYQNATGTSTNYYAMFVQTDGTIVFRQLELGVTTISLASAAGEVSAGTTYHFCLTRYGDIWTIRRNGLVVASTTDSTPLAKFTGTFRIGNFSTIGSHKGWISQFHFVDRAIWITDFTPADTLKRYPAAAYFRSTDRYLPGGLGTTDATQGGYWLLSESRPKATQFSCIADGVLSASDAYIGGTDNLAAFKNFLDYCAVRRVDGYIPEGTYMLSAELPHTHDVMLWGAGKDKTVIHARVAEDESAIRLYPIGTGGGVDGLTSIVEPYEAKLNNEGQYHSALAVGGIYYSVNPLPPIQHFRATNVRLKRSGISSGYAMYVMGHVLGGTVDRIDDNGNKRRHSGGYTQHWDGLKISGVLTRTFHPGDIDVGVMRWEASGVACALSSSYDTTIRRIIAKNASKLFYWLPGDEANRLANAAQKHRIGRGIRIGSIEFADMSSDADDAVDLFSVATSQFENYPAPDSGFRIRTTLDSDIEIGAIVGRNAVPVATNLFNGFQFHGSLKVGKIDAGNSFSAATVSIDRCIGGKMTFDKVIAETATAGSNIVEVTNSSDISMPELWLKHDDYATSSSRCVYCVGSTVSTTLAANAAQNATTITIVAASDRILKDQILYVDGHAVRATESYPAGMTTIGITKLPAAAAAGAAVIIDYRGGSVHLGLYTRGGSRGILIEKMRATLSGPGPSGTGQYAYQVNDGAIIDLMPTETRRNGRQRADDGTTATREILCAVGSRVRHHGGALGIDGQFVSANVACPVSDAGTDRRYLANMVVFEGHASGGSRVSASDPSDFQLANCTDNTGASVTN